MAATKPPTPANGAPRRQQKRAQRMAPPATREYLPGTPVDEHGNPLDHASLPEDVARSLPLDADSCRAAEEYDRQMQAKVRGERIEWNADERVAYAQVVRLHPNATVYFKQVDPVPDDNIDSRSVSYLPEYGHMVKYLRETHWSGQAATYSWVIADRTRPTGWCKGLVRFAARTFVEEDGAQVQSHQQQFQPNPAPPAYPQFPYGMPGTQPPVFMASQPVYREPAPVPPAPPPIDLRQIAQILQHASHGGGGGGIPPEVFTAVLQQLERQSAYNAQLAEQFRQLQQAPQVVQPQQDPQQAWLMNFLLQYLPKPQDLKPAEPPPPAPPPPAPPDPIQGMKAMIQQARELNNLGRSLARDFAPPQPLQENPTTLPNSPPDEMPYATHDMGLFRAVMAKPGGPEPSTIEKVALNGDKIGSFIELVLDKVMARRQENASQPAQEDPQIIQQREKVELLERAAAAHRVLVQPTAVQHVSPPTPTPPHVHVAPPMPPAPVHHIVTEPEPVSSPPIARVPQTMNPFVALAGSAPEPEPEPEPEPVSVIDEEIGPEVSPEEAPTEPPPPEPQPEQEPAPIPEEVPPPEVPAPVPAPAATLTS